MPPNRKDIRKNGIMTNADRVPIIVNNQPLKNRARKTPTLYNAIAMPNKRSPAMS